MLINISIGIGLAFLAMLCWGIGDFYIQKSTRKIGDIEALFLISLIGGILVAPFVWRDIPAVLFSGTNTLLIILSTCVVLLVASILDFEALRRGKLSVVEPIWSLEIPVAAFLAFLLIGERITFWQIILVVSLIVFLILVGFKEKKFSKKFLMEKGVIVAILGGVTMGGANFFMGWGGRITDPLMINFITDAFIAVATGMYLLKNGRFFKTFKDFRSNFGIVIRMSITDKVAWVSFVFAMTLAPIAIATALSESYIIVAVLLGLFVNKEKLHIHQKIGLVGAIAVAIVLAMTTIY